MDRRKQLEGAIEKVDHEAEAIKSDLESIRQNRLLMLRASAGSSSTSNNTEGSPAPSSGHMVRPDSCAHGTPTPHSDFNVTPCTPSNLKSPTFPDSQSTISNTSHNRSTSAPPNTSHPVKSELGIPAPTQPTNPFPVPNDSVYFESAASPSDAKAMTSSVDKIMSKYLKDATTEREVTSSTAFPSPNTKKKRALNLHNSSDTEVTSTTPHRDVDNRFTPKSTSKQSTAVKSKKAERKKKTMPCDPHLAKLTLEQPSSRDVTSSWVTAHDGSCDRSKSMLTNQSPKPTSLTSEQSEIALLRMRTLEHHSASVLSVYVTKCGKILSCSKDKTLCIADTETGQLLERYDLPGVPFRTCIVCNGKSITLYVVFVNDERGKTLLAESALHSVQINLQSDVPDVDTSQPRMKKLFEHYSCIMCIHQHQQFLYLGTRDGNVLIFCINTNRVLQCLDCHSPHAVCCLATGSDGGRRVVCCGSSDCTISVRDAGDGLLLKALLGHNKTINCMQLHRNLIYSGSSDRNVLVHNIQTGEILHRFYNMHGGSIKSLFFHSDAIITLCLDKSIRVLKSEPCRVSGSPKALESLPLSMHIQFHKLGGTWEDSNVLLGYAYVGCQDGKIQVVPLNQLAYKVACQTDVAMPDVHVKQEIQEDLFDLNVGTNLECMWNSCGASGFTTPSSLLTHVNLFHATDSYKENLNCCCLWANCTHYFSADIDTALEVHLHMDKHVSDAVRSSRIT